MENFIQEVNASHPLVNIVMVVMTYNIPRTLVVTVVSGAYAVVFKMARTFMIVLSVLFVVVTLVVVVVINHHMTVSAVVPVTIPVVVAVVVSPVIPTPFRE